MTSATLASHRHYSCYSDYCLGDPPAVHCHGDFLGQYHGGPDCGCGLEFVEYRCCHSQQYTGSQGLATSVGAGLTTISALLSGVSGSTDLTVDSAVLVSIDVAPTDPSIPMGLTQQFSASGNFSDGSVQDLTPLVTWSSSDTAVASVSNASGSNGLATPVAPGQTTITASFGGISGTSKLTVTSATLASITITSVTSYNRPGNYTAVYRDRNLFRRHFPGYHRIRGLEFIKRPGCDNQQCR